MYWHLAKTLARQVHPCDAISRYAYFETPLALFEKVESSRRDSQVLDTGTALPATLVPDRDKAPDWGMPTTSRAL
jgi:hypothetical protein